MLRADVLPEWHWRGGRTITSRDVIELLDKVVERGAPVMANNLAQMLVWAAMSSSMWSWPDGEPMRRSRSTIASCSRTFRLRSWIRSAAALLV
jgi:hypothetical protein